MTATLFVPTLAISTHSRAKAAGQRGSNNDAAIVISTHSRAKAAGRHFFRLLLQIGISTHSRAKAAGVNNQQVIPPERLFQLTAARRRLDVRNFGSWRIDEFQLTAARRRLVDIRRDSASSWAFQLTAARRRLAKYIAQTLTKPNFNSQPREGGWVRALSFGHLV